MFKIDFDSYVVTGESIVCDVDGFRCVATAHYDADTHCPADYPEPARTAWERDEWHYFGIAVTVWRAGVQLTGDFDHALWGIEGNCKTGDDSNVNAYFRAVANDQLPEAIAAAKEKIQELCK
jgi:hypothetical protein